MKLKDLKKMLNKLSKEQLEEELLYNSEEFSLSGVADITRAKANLYTRHEYDPSPLYTMKQLKEDGLDKEEIEGCDIEIPKGAFVLQF